MVAICPIIAALAAGLVSLVLPPVYEAKVSLLVRPAQPLTVDAGVAALTTDQISRTYARLMTEPPLLATVAADLGLSVSTDQLAKDIKIAPQANTSILDVAVDNTNRRLARDIANTLVNDFIQEIKQIEAQEGSSPNSRSRDNLVVVAPATLPDRPVSPNLPLNVAVAFVTGLLVAVGLAFLVDYLDQSIKTDDDLTERVGLIPIGHIPFAQSGKGRKAELVALTPDAPVAEAYRSLRTNILFSAIEREIKTIAVTSALPGEGKSRTAANLAVVLADAGLKTLLIDCDFRRPAQHRIFGRVANVGISNLFLQDRPESDVVMLVDEVPNLWLIASGPRPPNPSELLGSYRMKELLMKFRSSFTYIIMDTPPVTAVTDALIVGADADATILVVEHAKTSVAAIQHAQQALQRVGARVVGAVVNKVKPLGGEYYQYGYQYGSSDAPLRASAIERPGPAAAAASSDTAT